MQWFPPIDVLKSAQPDNVIVQRQQKMNSYVVAHRAVVIFYIYMMACTFTILYDYILQLVVWLSMKYCYTL